MKRIIKTFGLKVSALGIGLILVSPIGFNIYKGSDCNNSFMQISDDSVTDYDGNIYHTVKIGNQVWMVENLKVTHYGDGTPIPNVYDNDTWPLSKNGAYCLVNNDSVKYKNTYGILYNFYAVDNSHGLCPSGWHVPSEAECMTLINYLGGKDIAGSKLKDNRSKLWKTKNTYATNEGGFCGLPAGGRGRFGNTGDVGYYATWWSSTSYDSLYAWHWGLYPDKNGIRSNPGHKASGFSVRCIKD
jgi:uncharacterized protein (TIGR02145 family)